MKLVCEFDENKKLIHRKIVSDDYVLSANETLVTPPGDQYPPYIFDGTKFNGLTLEQYKQANHITDQVTTEPTAEQKLLMQQQAQITSLNESKKQQQQLIMQQQAMLAKLEQKLQ